MVSAGMMVPNLNDNLNKAAHTSLGNRYIWRHGFVNGGEVNFCKFFVSNETLKKCDLQTNGSVSTAITYVGMEHHDVQYEVSIVAFILNKLC